jgi:AcrR family transcriptional regulator
VRNESCDASAVTGLREQKKHATRQALRTAALRLALEHGPDQVRVDDIAAAAGVSPRTYNNYYPSREHAIVAAVTAERGERVAAAVRTRRANVHLSTAVSDAIVQTYTETGDDGRDALLLITTHPALRQVFVDTTREVEQPLAAAITQRGAGIDPNTAQVLAASVGAAVRVALRRWIRPSGPAGLVVVSESLPGLLREALKPLAPALDAAERRR